MSEHIPIEIQIEVIRRLPVKSVIRFACVSKQWKSLIHSSKFVNDYSLHKHHQIHQPLIFVAERDAREPYRFFVDDDTFPQNKSIPFVPKSVNLLKFSKVVGISHGLFCLVGYALNTLEMVIVIWNPMIRKSVSIGVPNVVFDPYYNGHGSIILFGVCPNTCDPKIVKINQKMRPEYFQDINGTNWQVEVFTLSYGVWRSPLGNLPDKWLNLFKDNEQVVIDGFIYWIVRERTSSNTTLLALISFNLTSEEFKQLYLPDKIASCSHIFNFRESVALFEWKSSQVCIWIRDGASKSFTKLFTFDGNGFGLYVSRQPVFRT